MNQYLQYRSRYRVNGELKDLDIYIREIQPESSGTRKDQEHISEHEYLTVVGFLNKDEEKFSKALKDIECFNNFKIAPKLHATLLGLPRSIAHSNEHDKAKKIVKAFFDNIGKDMPRFNITFKQIRPGTLHHRGLPVTGCGNGTVFADAERNEIVEKFHKLGNDLALHMRNSDELKGLIPRNFERKFPTVWCTLGYFDSGDFPLSQGLYNLFRSDSFWNCNTLVEIDRLSLVSFRNTKLEFANELWGRNLN